MHVDAIVALVPAGHRQAGDVHRVMAETTIDREDTWHELLSLTTEQQAWKNA
jgi:hypothetical protein